MRRAVFLLPVVLFSSDARAAEPVPVYVTVIGEGSIRVLLSAGAIKPCDSLSGKPIFDGWLASGRTYVFSSSEIVVCERHTYGAMRAGDWLPDRWWRLRTTRTDDRVPWRSMDIVLYTDRR